MDSDRRDQSANQRRKRSVKKRCSVDGCPRDARCWGFCGMHYQRVAKYGEPGQAEPIGKFGENNPKWRGGRIRGGEKKRYWNIYSPDHPNATKDGYVLEHRLVMEKELGRFLDPSEIVHHLNEDPSDNRPENLSVTIQSEHAREHGLTRVRDKFGRFT